MNLTILTNVIFIFIKVSLLVCPSYGWRNTKKKRRHTANDITMADNIK